MLQARQSALRSAQRLRPRVQRRFESSHGHDSHHAEPVNESFGRNFFLTIAALPLGYLVISSTQGTEENPSALTNLIHKYTDYKDRWAKRNALHTAAAEQAAFDRALFEGHRAPKTLTVGNNLELLNDHSPYTQHAGHRADLRELIKHVDEENRKADEKITKRSQLEITKS